MCIYYFFRSEADDPSYSYNYENQSRNDSVPFQQYSADNQSDDDDDLSEEDDDLDLESECHCDHTKNETCPVCVRVQSPEVYRIDFTEMPGEHSGDQDSGSFNGEPSSTRARVDSKDGCESISGDKTSVDIQGMQSDVTDGIKNAGSSVVHENGSNVSEEHPENPQIIISDVVIENQKSHELNGETAKNASKDKGSKQSVKRDPKTVRRKERTPKHSKKKERILREGDKDVLKPDEKSEKIEEQREDLSQTNRFVKSTEWVHQYRISHYPQFSCCLIQIEVFTYCNSSVIFENQNCYLREPKLSC